MAVLRFLAMLCLLVAAIALATDATRAYWTGSQLATPLAKHVTDLAPNAMIAAEQAVGRSMHPLVWNAGIKPVLALPAWVSFTALALIVGWIGRRRRRVNIYAN
jgi:hypothetical protein